MHEWASLSHVRWECKYHVVIIPKYRQKALYGQLKKRIGGILRELCEQRGVELIEGKAMANHVHMCLSHGGALLPSRQLPVVVVPCASIPDVAVDRRKAPLHGA